MTPCWSSIGNNMASYRCTAVAATEFTVVRLNQLATPCIMWVCIDGIPCMLCQIKSCMCVICNWLFHHQQVVKSMYCDSAHGLSTASAVFESNGRIPLFRLPPVDSLGAWKRHDGCDVREQHTSMQTIACARSTLCSCSSHNGFGRMLLLLPKLKLPASLQGAVNSNMPYRYN